MNFKYLILIIYLNFITYTYCTWGIDCDLCTGDGAIICQVDYKICICNDGYTGSYCNITTNLIVNDYIPADPDVGGYGWLSGYFKNTTDLIIQIGGEVIEYGVISQYSLRIFVNPLDPNKTYDVLIKQGSLEWYGKDFYSPTGFKCELAHGYPFSGVCYCSRGWTGNTCNDSSPIAIDSIIPNELPITGGDIIINGWFGNSDYQYLNFTIGVSNNSIKINSINSTYIQGTITFNHDETSTIINQYQDINIYNTTNNSSIFKGQSLVYFNSTLCNSECLTQCINSICIQTQTPSLPNSSSSSSSSSSTSSSLSSSSSINSNSNNSDSGDSSDNINNKNSVISFINFNFIFIASIVIIIYI